MEENKVENEVVEAVTETAVAEKEEVKAVENESKYAIEKVTDAETEKLFQNILERGEEIVRTYRPNRKAFKTSVYLPFLLVPVIGWVMLILAFPVIFFVVRAYLNKRAYAVTDRRILVRGGIIGVDYKSLKINSINATTVFV